MIIILYSGDLSYNLSSDITVRFEYRLYTKSNRSLILRIYSSLY